MSRFQGFFGCFKLGSSPAQNAQPPALTGEQDCGGSSDATARACDKSNRGAGYWLNGAQCSSSSSEPHHIVIEGDDKDRSDDRKADERGDVLEANRGWATFDLLIHQVEEEATIDDR